jgi:hypothetical protein
MSVPVHAKRTTLVGPEQETLAGRIEAFMVTRYLAIAEA